MAGAPARFAVVLTAGAEQDLVSIHGYLSDAEGRAQAERLLDALLAVAATLSGFPERGSIPKELIGLGITEYRQVMLQRYRLIYRTTGSDVIIHVIADGRRDMQSLLSNRLLGA